MKKQLFLFAVLTAAFTNSAFAGYWFHFSNNMPFPVKSEAIYEQKDSNGVIYNKQIVKTEVTQPYSVTFSQMDTIYAGKYSNNYPTKIVFTALDGQEKPTEWKLDDRIRTRAFEIWPLEYANPKKGFYIKELNSQDAEDRAILK